MSVEILNNFVYNDIKNIIEGYINCECCDEDCGLCSFCEMELCYCECLFCENCDKGLNSYYNINNDYIFCEECFINSYKVVCCKKCRKNILENDTERGIIDKDDYFLEYNFGCFRRDFDSLLNCVDFNYDDICSKCINKQNKNRKLKR